jgi:hypothetical protein
LDLALTETERAFRGEVRAFLRERLTPELRAAGAAQTRDAGEHDAAVVDAEFPRPAQSDRVRPVAASSTDGVRA